MPSYKSYTDDQYKAFLKQPYSNNFGISEEAIADWFMGQAGSYAVRVSYGVNKSNLLSTYIPKLKEKLGGYVFFLAYTVTEGGGAGNWINHYAYDTGGNGLQCLIDDCDYLLSINNGYNGYPVAMTAPEVAGSPPAGNIATAQAVYNECGKNSIGAVMMPSTMAGNAWVFAEQWCLANQSSSAPGVYFGNPYDQIINMLKNAGANPFSGVAGNGSDKSAQDKQNDTKTSDKPSQEDLLANLKKAFEEVIKQLKDQFKKPVPTQSLNNLVYSNNVLKIEELWGEAILKAQLHPDFYKKLEDIFLKAYNQLSQPTTPSINTNKTTGNADSNTPTPPSSNSGNPKVSEAIAYIRGMSGRTIGDGQCYAMTGWYSWMIDGGDISYNNGHQMRRLIGDGWAAANIGSGWDWTGWTVINNPQPSQFKIGQIANIKSYYGGVWFTGAAGHTGVITGLDDNTVEFTDQNYLNQGHVQIRQYPRSSFHLGLTSIITPPGL